MTGGAGDPFGLGRFVEAQESGRTYEHALAELRSGRKTGHWMWFVFPQIAGLGQSATSKRYAIASLTEARAYLRHRVLGPRIVECSKALAELQSGTAEGILGGIDAVKLRSSMTLFLRAAPNEPVFGQVLDRYFDGRPDPETDARLGPVGDPPTGPGGTAP